VTLEVGGRKVLAYPGYVAGETTVDLRLFDTASAAAAATRDGLRKLFLMHSGTTLSKLELQLPGALGQWKKPIALRALDDAFGTELPVDLAAWNERVAAGRRKLPDALGELVRVALELTTELDKVMALMKPLAARPGNTRIALDDIKSQLSSLVPADLIRTSTRLPHVVRYLKALVVRLQRLNHDPNKDAAKLALVAPFWAQAQARPDLAEFRWLVEEFRIATFAPELRAAVTVSPQRLQEAWKALTG